MWDIDHSCRIDFGDGVLVLLVFQDASRYCLTPEDYLMRLDPVTNKMAVVVSTPEARAELIRRFHLDFDRHPHWKQQVYMIRQLVFWRS